MRQSRYSTRTLLVLFGVAALAALLHMLPFWRAQSQTPPGYTFTGNISNSPDMMQYRVWSRQSLDSGVLVTDKFTTEPNKPHILIILYFVIGKFSELFNTTPEYVYAYIGAIFVFLFVLLLYFIIRQFFSIKSQVWWVLFVTLFGGGFGAYIMVLSNQNFVRNNFLLKKTLVEGFWSWRPLFEVYRGNYIVNSLFDTHFIFIWLLASLSLLLLFLTLQRFSWPRLALTVTMFILTTLVHVYEGITLGTILVMITGLLWKRKLATKSVYLTFTFLMSSIVFGIVFFYFLYRSSGLELPDWRGVNVLFSILMLAYPLAWFVIFPGIVNFWQSARYEETFLIGWALGCLVLTLSGPYYPFPDRGTMTLQIPLYLIAGLIYFRNFKKVTWPVAIFILIVAGMTPAWVLQRRWEDASFSPDYPAIWMSNDHTDLVKKLNSVATENDILITDMSKVDWEVDPLWLAPNYPGKFYSAHFFLTVDFENKRNELIEFYKPLAEISDQIEFLNAKQIRYVYVDATQNPARFDNVPGLKLLINNPVGALYEYDPAQAN